LVIGAAAGIAFMAYRVPRIDDAAAILLTGFVAVAVAVLAAAIAFYAAWDSREVARLRATLDYLSRSESDGDLIAANRTFIECTKVDHGLVKWAEPEHDSGEQAQAIRLILNDFELVAIGIQLGIMDYELYKRWARSNVLFYWRKAHPFVARVRERLDRPMLWNEFEQMARWMDENSPPVRRFR